MRNSTLLVVNGLLVIAVAVLFYLHFSSKKCDTVQCKKNPATKGSFKIAYFEMDSLQNNYTYYKQVIKELGQSEQLKRNELQQKKNANISKMQEYQKKGSSMTQLDMQKAQEDMAQREKDYQLFEQMKSSEYQDESLKKLHDVKKKIEDYLKEYNKDKTYSYILMNSSDIIFYKDSAFDITADLIKGLNDSYKKKH